jgi:hypothetical protein
MKIELTKDEWNWLKSIVSNQREFCERYHPSNGGVSLDIYLPDEEVIRNIWNKLGEEWKDDTQP